MKKGKIQEKHIHEIANKEKCSVLCLFFLLFSFLSLFPFFLLSNPVLLVLLVLNFVFASTPCPRGRKGGGGSFRVQSLMMTLEMYIDTYIVVQRGPGNRLNRPKLCFLLVIVEIIRDCGQAGKEKLFVFLFFRIVALF